jgi:hypothetical protein
MVIGTGYPYTDAHKDGDSNTYTNGDTYSRSFTDTYGRPYGTGQGMVYFARRYYYSKLTCDRPACDYDCGYA